MTIDEALKVAARLEADGACSEVGLAARALAKAYLNLLGYVPSQTWEHNGVEIHRIEKYLPE